MRSVFAVLTTLFSVGCASEQVASTREYISVADYTDRVVFVIPGGDTRPAFSFEDANNPDAVPVVIEFFDGVAAAWRVGSDHHKMDNLITLYRVGSASAGSKSALRDDTVSGGTRPPSQPATPAEKPRSNGLAPSGVNALRSGPIQIESLDQVILIDWLDRLADPELFDRLSQVHVGC